MFTTLLIGLGSLAVGAVGGIIGFSATKNPEIVIQQPTIQDGAAAGTDWGKIALYGAAAIGYYMAFKKVKKVL